MAVSLWGIPKRRSNSIDIGGLGHKVHIPLSPYDMIGIAILRNFSRISPLQGTLEYKD
jgi:hypothetical protein